MQLRIFPSSPGTPGEGAGLTWTIEDHGNLETPKKLHGAISGSLRGCFFQLLRETFDTGGGGFEF